MTRFVEFTCAGPPVDGRSIAFNVAHVVGVFPDGDSRTAIVTTCEAHEGAQALVVAESYADVLKRLRGEPG